MAPSPVFLDKIPIAREEIVSIARRGMKAALSEECEKRVERTRELVRRWVEEEKIIYGITTGFGALCDRTISKRDTRRLQENILMSHAAGVGRHFSEEIVRAMMALRIHDLSLGYGGVRMETLRFLLTLLNEDVTPCIPEKGSVGASGDLAPAAHMALLLIGRGEAFFKGRRLSGEEALGLIGLEPIRQIGRAHV